MQNWLEIGKIVRSHGIKGAVKVLSYLDGVSFSMFKRIYIGLKKEEGIITRVQPLNGGAFAITVNIIPDIDTAEKYRNLSVYIDRADYPEFEDKVYLSDIIGCPLLDENGEKLGELLDFNDYGASTILEIKCGFSTYSIPFVEEIVKYDNKMKALVTTKQVFEDVRVWK